MPYDKRGLCIRIALLTIIMCCYAQFQNEIR